MSTYLLRLALIALASVLPLAAQAPAAAVVNKPTLFLIGGLATAEAHSLFDPARITLVDSPAQGQTTRTYINSGQWDTLLARIKPGDFVLIDFNPEDTTSQDQAAARRTLEGDGDGTFDYLDPGTHKLELIHSYGWYLRKLVVDVINQGANPILAAPSSSATQPARDQTPIAQNGRDSMSPNALALAPATSTPPPSHPGAPKPGTTYPDWAKAIATEQRIPFADLGTATATLSASGIRTALETMKPDPLAPYLTR